MRAVLTVFLTSGNILSAKSCSYVRADEEERRLLPPVSQGHSADGRWLSLAADLANKTRSSASPSGGKSCSLQWFVLCVAQSKAEPVQPPCGEEAGSQSARAGLVAALVWYSFLLVSVHVSFEAVIPRSVVCWSCLCAACATFALICDSLACSYFTDDAL